MRFLDRLPFVYSRSALCIIAVHCTLWHCLCLNQAVAQNGSTPGTPTAPFPTIENLSIVWPIDGDDNNNGSVAVRYRETGQSAWMDSAPLRRVPTGSNAGFSWQNKHAGSILSVDADTSYEIELALTDPDGGGATQIISAATRPWPVSSDQGMVVTPNTIAAALANISAGDVLVLADGNYTGLNVFANGTLTAPIVIRGENVGGAIVDGVIRFDGNGFIHIVGLTVEGQIKFNGSNDIVIRDCLINTDRDGIVSFGAGVSNALIINNTCDFNYDGFGSIGTGAFVGRIGATSFIGLAQLQTLTTESNAVQLDLSVFAASVSIPANPVAEHAPPNFALVSGGAAIDAGIALAGFNDAFTGGSPDLGAYELGKATPVYGVGGNLGADDPVVLLGDCNQDGVVDFLDISPLIDILANGPFLAQADCNQDGEVNFLDIGPFIEILTGN